MGQVNTLFEELQKIKQEEFRIQAALQGVDLSKDTQSPSSDNMMFKDPSEYDDLSEEERENLTQEMMSKHKGWVNKSGIKG